MAEAAIPSAEDAPIAILVDLTSGQTLFSREADRQFAPASITKVMTVFTTFEQLKDGKLELTQVMSPRPKTFQQWRRTGSTMYLAHDAKVQVQDLLHGVTSVSANDGAAVLAEGAAGSIGNWLALMNLNARRLGMDNSYFATPNGWPDGGATYTTAHDLVTLADATITRHPQLYRAFYGQPVFTYAGITQQNRDPISGKVAGADGLKTGYTDQAGFGFLGSAERDGRRLAMVVATSDTARARDRAARSLIEWGFSAFELQTLLPSGRPVAFAAVQNGAAAEVPLVAERPVAVTIPRGTRPQVTMTVSYSGPLQAPIQAGQPIGRLNITVAGMPSYSIPLKSGEDVGIAGPLRRVVNGIVGWLS